MMLNERLLQANRAALRGGILLLGLALGSASWAADGDQSANAIEKVEASAISGQTLVKVTLREPLAAAPASFTVSAPPRIAFDFLATENVSGTSSQQYSLSELQSINVVQAGGRTRLVLNLNRSSRYETRLEGKSLYISLAGGASDVLPTATQAQRSVASTLSVPEGNSVQNLDFRAESSDVATIKIDVAEPNPLVDVKRQGASLVVSLLGTKLPDRLARRLDVRDFGTPITNVTATAITQGAQIAIATRGEWDFNVTQLDTAVKIEVRRRVLDPNSLLGAKELQGKTVSFNFTQPVPVSQMIGIFQDITGLNFVMMPGVTGEIERLKMENTPVETAINVVCRMYGLAMRRFDGLVVVGKAADIAKYEKEEADLKNARLDTEPVEQESIKARYRPAAEIVASLTGVVATYTQSSTVSTTIQAQPAGSSGNTGGTSGSTAQGSNSSATATAKSMISARGSISSDSVTNTIFVEETKSQIAKIRERVAELDRPVRQVMIDARIVSVNSSFSRTLGVKLSFVQTSNSGTINGTANVLSPNAPPGITGVTGQYSLSGGFNAANATNKGSLQFGLFNSNATRLLNAELDASETDGATRNIANPKILTQDGRQATITDGSTLFFQLSGGINGPTTVSIDAATKLEVTPQIGADGKVQMKVYVNKGGVGATVGGNPSVIKQEVVTNAVVENGGTLMLGGVFTQIAGNTTDGVPLLRDIPGLGWLFKQNVKTDDKTELLIFLTPRVVTEELTLQ
jgi:type IV pilus assembly protein PilQ